MENNTLQTLNQSRIEKIIGDDHNLKAILFQAFLDSLETLLSGQPSPEAIHTLKGSAANMGADKLAFLCLEMEKNPSGENMLKLLEESEALKMEIAKFMR